MATHLRSIIFLMILNNALRYCSWMFELIQYWLFGIRLPSRCFCFASQWNCCMTVSRVIKDADNVTCKKKKYTDNIATLSFLFYSLTLNIMLTSLYFLSGIIQIIIYHFSSLGNKTRHLTVFFFWEDTWSFVNHDLSFSTASKATPNHPSFSTLGCTCCIWFYSFILRIQFEKSFTFTFAL